MREPPLSDLIERLSARGPVPDTGLESTDSSTDSPMGLWERLETGERGLPEVRVIDKQRYCRDCTRFADPPQVACSREGTEIEALVGSGRFRVRNCPVDRE